MDIERDTNFVLFQAARALVSPAYFLCVFEHELPEPQEPDIRVAIAQSTGDVHGPLVLNLTETGSAIAVNGQVDLYPADWQLTVYEQTSATNIDPAGAGREVWSELVRVYDPSGGIAPRPPYDPCANCGPSGPCEDAQLRVNGVYDAFIPSGGILIFPIVQDDVLVGAWNGSQWEVPSCPASCDLDVVIIMNGVEVANITGLDPCEDNEIIVN